MALTALIDEREQCQKCHCRALHRKTDEFIGKYFEGLVIGQKVPLGFDMGRSLEWIGGNKRFPGEEKIRIKKYHCQEKRQIKGNGGGILEEIVGKERDAARMVFVTIVATLPLVTAILEAERRR